MYCMYCCSAVLPICTALYLKLIVLQWALGSLWLLVACANVCAWLYVCFTYDLCALAKLVSALSAQTPGDHCLALYEEAGVYLTLLLCPHCIL